jgi:hypothetical protein
MVPDATAARDGNRRRTSGSLRESLLMLTLRRLALPATIAAALALAGPSAAHAAGLKTGTNTLKGGTTELTLDKRITTVLGGRTVTLGNLTNGRPATSYRVSGGSMVIRPGRPMTGTVLHRDGMRFTQESKTVSLAKLRLNLKARTLEANVDGARTRNVVGTVSRVKMNRSRTTITATVNLSQPLAELLDTRFGLAGLVDYTTVLGTVKITPRR